MKMIYQVAAVLCAAAILGQVGCCDAGTISFWECLLRVLGCVFALMACYAMECRGRMKKRR